MDWKRPSSVPFPSVWHRFTGRPLPDGTVPSFRVQDIPEEMDDQVVDFMCEHFAVQEPTCKSQDLINDPQSVKEMRELWYHALKDRLGLICFHEIPEGDVMVGTNITTLSRRGEGDFKITGKSLSVVLGALEVITKQADVHNKYNVDFYLSAMGLSVSRQYQGQNIGKEILMARIPLCKAVGIKITGTVFTAIQSQVLAKKCGFEDLVVITYKDMKEKYGYDFKDIETVATKYMVLPIQ